MVAISVNYITQQRSIGKLLCAEVIILAAFRRSVGDVTVRDIRPEMILRFVDRGATGHGTRSRKYRVLAGLFFFAVTRRFLRTSPIPAPPPDPHYSSFVPYHHS